MKAAPFDYARAANLPEVCELLAGAGDRKIIAGGQTLVPLMAMRLARPTLLIDINAVAELAGIEPGAGAVAIHACTRQADAQASPIVASRLPLLHRALDWVGHQQTRNRGTIGGSIVNADPSAEIPLVAATLQARLTLVSLQGEESVAAEDFFEAPMVTSIRPDQCLKTILFPVWTGRIGCAFHEVSIRAGDFAAVAVAVQVELDASGHCVRAVVGVGGSNPVPVRIAAAGAGLVGAAPDADRIRAAAMIARDTVQPDGDLHVTADYRRRMTAVLVERALRDAFDEARLSLQAP